VYIGGWRVDFGHLWFVAHVLAYGTLYVAWRVITRRGADARPVPRVSPASPTRDQAPPPTGVTILGFTLTLALATALVRLASPADRWVSLLGFLPAEPAHLPQYAALFVVGVVPFSFLSAAGLRRLPGLRSVL
jgi:glucan biosynthesis protein C